MHGSLLLQRLGNILVWSCCVTRGFRLLSNIGFFEGNRREVTKLVMGGPLPSQGVFFVKEALHRGGVSQESTASHTNSSL